MGPMLTLIRVSRFQLHNTWTKEDKIIISITFSLNPAMMPLKNEERPLQNMHWNLFAM